MTLLSLPALPVTQNLLSRLTARWTREVATAAESSASATLPQAVGDAHEACASRRRSARAVASARPRPCAVAPPAPAPDAGTKQSSVRRAEVVPHTGAAHAAARRRGTSPVLAPPTGRALTIVPAPSPRPLLPSVAALTEWIERDVAVIDVETTGLKPKHAQIVQLGATRLDRDGTLRRFASLVYTRKPISAGALEAHGIAQERLNGAPTFREIAPALTGFLAGTMLVGYNSKAFDIGMLINAYNRAGINPADRPALTAIDTYRIFRSHVTEASTAAVTAPGDPGTFKLAQQAYPFYAGQPMVGAHDAGCDADATLEVFAEQMRVHPLPRDLWALYQLSGAPNTHVCWAKGEDILVDTPRSRWSPAERAAAARAAAVPAHAKGRKRRAAALALDPPPTAGAEPRKRRRAGGAAPPPLALPDVADAVAA